MSRSGAQLRPARVLIVAGGLDVERVQQAIRAHGCLVEVVKTPSVAVDRLAQDPAIDVLFIDGVGDLERERVLAAARARGAWSIHLRSGRTPALPAMHRQQLLAALPLDADDAKITRMLAAVLAARRSKPTRSSA